MAHLVFPDTQANTPKTKRAIFCQRTDKTVNKKMKQIDTNKNNFFTFGQILPKQNMSKTDNITFGEYIRTLRENANLPLRKVAAELDIDTSTLSKIEKNERNANEQIIDGISRIFHIDKSELKVRYLSDKITYQLQDEENGLEILKVAEEKIKYHRKQK
jgi:HTH-type transcriptional regulator, competence development regulator